MCSANIGQDRITSFLHYLLCVCTRFGVSHLEIAHDGPLNSSQCLLNVSLSFVLQQLGTCCLHALYASLSQSNAINTKHPNIFFLYPCLLKSYPLNQAVPIMIHTIASLRVPRDSTSPLCGGPAALWWCLAMVELTLVR